MNHDELEPYGAAGNRIPTPTRSEPKTYAT